ncbi:MAG: pyridoxamine 5'-phosphate oxidase family protein [Acidimicrobiales bacterium]
MGTDETDGVITDAASLRRVYREQAAGAVTKDVGRIDPAAAEFIALAPLCVLASTDGSTLDASPRGGSAGFVQVLGPQRLAFGDLVGNNRLDTYTNPVANPSIGIIFFVPGAEETLRINGIATVSEDTALRQR